MQTRVGHRAAEFFVLFLERLLELLEGRVVLAEMGPAMRQGGVQKVDEIGSADPHPLRS